MELKELGSVCDLQNGFAFKSDDYIDHSQTVSLRMSNIRPGGKFDNTYNLRYLPDSFQEKYSNYLISDGDLVIAMTDLANDPKILGIPTIVETGYNTWLLNQRAGKLIVKDSSKADKNYLRYILNHPIHRNYYKMFAGGGLQINVGKKEVLGVKIPLPPLKTQQHIAQVLDDAAALRDKTKKLLTEYDLLAQSFFLEMFGNPLANPKKFDRVTLESLTNISSGSTPSREIESYWGGSIPWVRTGEVNSKLIIETEEKITEEGLRNSSCKLYKKGSIIIAMYGQGKTRGQVAILGIDATTNQACAVLQPSNKINFTYLYEYLKSSYEDLRSLGRGGNQPNLNAGLIKSYKVMNPPIEFQTQFAEKIALIEQLKELAQQELKESENLFNSLLQKAFKGELVPQHV